MIVFQNTPIANLAMVRPLNNSKALEIAAPKKTFTYLRAQVVTLPTPRIPSTRHFQHSCRSCFPFRSTLSLRPEYRVHLLLFSGSLRRLLPIAVDEPRRNRDAIIVVHDQIERYQCANWYREYRVGKRWGKDINCNMNFRKYFQIS